MSRKIRTLTAVAVAGAVALAGAGAGVAQAQPSSFPDLSSILRSYVDGPEPEGDPGPGGGPEEPGPHEGLARQLRSTFQALHDQVGVPVDGELLRKAEDYAERAAAGEFDYQPVTDDPRSAGIYVEVDEREEDEEVTFHAAVWKLTPEQAEIWAEGLNELIERNPEGVDEALRAGSYAVDSDEEYVYIAFYGWAAAS